MSVVTHRVAVFVIGTLPSSLSLTDDGQLSCPDGIFELARVCAPPCRGARRAVAPATARRRQIETGSVVQTRGARRSYRAGPYRHARASREWRAVDDRLQRRWRGRSRQPSGLDADAVPLGLRDEPRRIVGEQVTLGDEPLGGDADRGNVGLARRVALLDRR